MRFQISFLAATLLIAAPSQAATRNFTVTGFDRIRVDGPFRVNLTTAVAPFARASGDQAALDGISLDVQGRTLIIRRNASASSGTNRPSGPVTISVGTHDLTAAWVNGSGGLAIDKVKAQSFDLSVTGSGAAEIAKLSVDRLRVSVTGSAGVTLGGTAETGTITVTGPSSIDASSLRVKTATVSAEGPSTIRLTATGTAKVDARGLATVDLSGGPACTIRPATNADVRGCR